MGFGAAAKREKVAPVLLMGIAAAGDDAAAKLAADAGIDALIVTGAKGVKKADLDNSLKFITMIVFRVQTKILGIYSPIPTTWGSIRI